MNEKEILAGMLIFQSPAKTGGFEQAIQKSFEKTNITHVGLAIDKRTIIQAHSEKGVIATFIDDFLKQAQSNIIVQFDDSSRIEKACQFAQKQLGKPYNHLFLPDGEGFYCSQLIYEAYNQQSPPLFAQDKLNFMSADQSDILPYWKRYYARYGLEVPQGKPGTHPAGLLKQIDKINFKGIIYN